MAETSANTAASVEDQPPTFSFKKRGAKATGSIRKRPAASTLTREDDSSDFSSSEDESGHRVKQRKKNTGVVTASSANNKHTDKEFTAENGSTDRPVPITDTNDATKHSDWFDEGTSDARSSKTRDASKEEAEAQVPDGTYRGLANQTNFIRKNPNAPTKSFGPIKAPTNVRTITTTDYSPGVCKDYKLTGFCGFGDSCIFLHDRTDYKQGWQLDQDWENVTKGKNVKGKVVANADRSRRAEQEDDDEESMLEEIPFACIICQGPYREPVVTKCGHYFCEPCALGRYRKDSSCAACGAGTSGLFSSAKRLKKLLDKKRERMAKERQAAIDAGEEVSSEEEE